MSCLRCTLNRYLTIWLQLFKTLATILLNNCLEYKLFNKMIWARCIYLFVFHSDKEQHESTEEINMYSRMNRVQNTVLSCNANVFICSSQRRAEAVKYSVVNCLKIKSPTNIKSNNYLWNILIRCLPFNFCYYSPKHILAGFFPAEE